MSNPAERYWAMQNALLLTDKDAIDEPPSPTSEWNEAIETTVKELWNLEVAEYVIDIIRGLKR